MPTIRIVLTGKIDPDDSGGNAPRCNSRPSVPRPDDGSCRHRWARLRCKGQRKVWHDPTANAASCTTSRLSARSSIPDWQSGSCSINGQAIEDVQQAVPRSGIFHAVDQRFDPRRQAPGIVSVISLPPLGTHIPASAVGPRPVPAVTGDLRPVADPPDQCMVADLQAQGIFRGLQQIDRFAVQRFGKVLENGAHEIPHDVLKLFSALRRAGCPH